MATCSEQAANGTQLDPQCLAIAAHHVAHDLELLRLAWGERQSRLGWTLWFILARSFMDFFFVDRKRGKDDISAADFPATQEWRPFAADLLKTAEALPDYRAVRDAANKNAAHLTYTRTEEDATSVIGPSEPVHRFLIGVAAEWLSRLTPESRVWFGDA